MWTVRSAQRRDPHQAPVQNPALLKVIAGDTRLAWLWLPLRLYAASLWIESGARKVTDPAWTGSGDALRQFWQSALKTDPRPMIEVGWYRGFIQYLLDNQAYAWFGKLIAWGELLTGVALFLGLFTGLAAASGALMNWNYIMAGSASLNGILLAIELLLIFAWKTAGWIGFDRDILTYLGTPWSPGLWFRRGRISPVPQWVPVRVPMAHPAPPDRRQRR